MSCSIRWRCQVSQLRLRRPCSRAAAVIVAPRAGAASTRARDSTTACSPRPGLTPAWPRGARRRASDTRAIEEDLGGVGSEVPGHRARGPVAPAGHPGRRPEDAAFEVGLEAGEGASEPELAVVRGGGGVDVDD